MILNDLDFALVVLWTMVKMKVKNLRHRLRH